MLFIVSCPIALFLLSPLIFLYFFLQVYFLSFKFLVLGSKRIFNFPCLLICDIKTVNVLLTTTLAPSHKFRYCSHCHSVLCVSYDLFCHILASFYFNDSLFTMVPSQALSFLSHIVLIFPYFFSISLLSTYISL